MEIEYCFCARGRRWHRWKRAYPPIPTQFHSRRLRLGLRLKECLEISNLPPKLTKFLVNCPVGLEIRKTPRQEVCAICALSVTSRAQQVWSYFNITIRKRRKWTTVDSTYLQAGL